MFRILCRLDVHVEINGELNRSHPEPEANHRAGIQSIGEYFRAPSTREEQALEGRLLLAGFPSRVLM
jgi:hypothetical protein